MDIKDVKAGEKYLVWCEVHELHRKVAIALTRDQTTVEMDRQFLCVSPDHLYPLDGSYYLCEGWKTCDSPCELHVIPHQRHGDYRFICAEGDSPCLPITEENIPRLFGTDKLKEAVEKCKEIDELYEKAGESDLAFPGKAGGFIPTPEQATQNQIDNMQKTIDQLTKRVEALESHMYYMENVNGKYKI